MSEPENTALPLSDEERKTLDEAITYLTERRAKFSKGTRQHLSVVMAAALALRIEDDARKKEKATEDSSSKLHAEYPATHWWDHKPVVGSVWKATSDSGWGDTAVRITNIDTDRNTITVERLVGDEGDIDLLYYSGDDIPSFVPGFNLDVWNYDLDCPAIGSVWAMPRASGDRLYAVEYVDTERHSFQATCISGNDVDARLSYREGKERRIPALHPRPHRVSHWNHNIDWPQPRTYWQRPPSSDLYVTDRGPAHLDNLGSGTSGAIKPLLVQHTLVGFSPIYTEPTVDEVEAEVDGEEPGQDETLTEYMARVGGA